MSSVFRAVRTVGIRTPGHCIGLQPGLHGDGRGGGAGRGAGGARVLHNSRCLGKALQSPESMCIPMALRGRRGPTQHAINKHNKAIARKLWYEHAEPHPLAHLLPPDLQVWL